MELTGLHLLLTYECNFECDHCFVWGGPHQSGTMTLSGVRHVLQEAQDLGSVEWIYFEGGEPFLYYAILSRGVQEAFEAGFKVGIVSNAYWATELEDALEWLRPFAGLVEDLSISNDLYHWDEETNQQVNNAIMAAEQLNIPIGTLSVAQPEAASAAAVGQLPIGESAVMYRGRAVEKLVPRATRHPWTKFTECPYEDLRDPGRVHVDPLGNLHICQGISLGNIFQTPLRQICEGYDPDTHPITGPLLENGPIQLVEQYGLGHENSYADACHLCYDIRLKLRTQFPEILTPGQVYGTFR